MSDPAVQRALDVKHRHEQGLLRRATVVAVGVGFCKRGVLTKEVCIVVSVKNKVPLSELKPRDVIPAQIEGVPVDVVETGEIGALLACHHLILYKLGIVSCPNHTRVSRSV